MSHTSKESGSLTIESVSLSDLFVDPDNARTHDQKNLDAIRGSLEKFGQQKPIVVTKTGRILAGNGTYAAAKALGWVTIDIVRTELKGKDAMAYALADNRSGELAAWDDAVLQATLSELQALDFDVEAIGFDPIEMDEGLASDTKADEIPETEENEFGVERGQIWQLGEHRLMCGDSTDKADVDQLIAGEKADMVFTDPPYGVSYQSNMRTRSEKFSVIENDDIFLTDWIELISDVSEGWVFVWTTWKVVARWIDITKPIGELTNVIVWDKGGGGIGDLTGTFSTDYEMGLVFNREAKITGRRLGSVWSIGKDRSSGYLHPTQKPVELGEMAITNCTKAKDRVLDLFLGSGSTLIACEKTNRKCYGMEIDPHYCSVIIKRWQDYTGNKATMILL